MDNLNHVKWRTVGCMQAICTNPPSRRLPAGLPSYYPGPEDPHKPSNPAPDPPSTPSKTEDYEANPKNEGAAALAHNLAQAGTTPPTTRPPAPSPQPLAPARPRPQPRISAVIYWPIYTYFSPAGSWLSFSKRLRIRVRRRDNRRICLFALDGAKSWRYRFISRRTAWRAASTAVASAAEVGAMPHWRAGTGIWCRGWRRAARYSRCKSCWVTSTYSRVMLAL